MKTARQITRKMIELFPGVRLPDLIDLVDANTGGATRGGVEGMIMSLGTEISEDDNEGLWIYDETQVP